MTSLGWLVSIELIIVIIYIVFLSRKKILQQKAEIKISASGKLPYKLQQNTLSNSEKEFYRVLTELEIIKNNFIFFLN